MASTPKSSRAPSWPIAAVEVLLGFWAAGDFGHKVILLVIWVGAAALTRGISEIVFAFQLRHMRSEA